MPSTAASHPLFNAACHRTRAVTLSMKISARYVTTTATIPITGFQAKKRKTKPRRKTFSYQ